jgi:threonine/homoserine/homoserine lactone efflux protein
MHSPLTVVAIVLAGTMTPGPNNFAMLQIAATGDRGAALRAGAAIVTGGLALYMLVHGGLEAWLSRHPWAAHSLSFGSAACLVWLGGTLIYRSFPSHCAHPAAALPASASGLLLFQLINPKGWALMTSVTAAAHCTHGCSMAAETLPVLLLTAIPAASLLAWHRLGLSARRLWAIDVSHPHLNRLAGAVLIASSLPLLQGI